MKQFNTLLWTKDEYSYSTVGSFIPSITAYLHEDNKPRPALLVVPGGGYRIVSPTEGEIVARKFYDMGYQTFVVTYSVNISNEPLFLQPLKDLSKAVQLVRKKSDEWLVDRKKVYVCGFSAGAHLAGSLAVHYNHKDINCQGENRPDKVILSYPVVTSGEFAHRDSFVALLGEAPSQSDLDFLSIEKNVSSTTPPMFIWQTRTDETVSVENSYLLVQACLKAGVSFEHHVFNEGPHGCSLADEKWANGDYKGSYTLQQFQDYFEYCLENEIVPAPPFSTFADFPKGTNFADLLLSGMKEHMAPKPIPSVSVWPKLVKNWLD
ncbi:alpha/beta hydrolase [Streptococcus moroccensis]|uniref:Acetyl esterase/lipase n=1 Tax=Streptococcus moroccensis TaxID=1451356 RepID=A0ABT9YPC7_9STRE|nr:alpha/beta hydrolase [Streptococcus moroccensis]MDQ0221834.1 acetyl esterase/lipase [Streptococcus moroccensis]